ncbi:MAG: biosynthetic-type acetolactate synthase large subunit [Leptospirales bacterium]|nr:biosynthetic-type acetolactate synthase large subunit [Leptospirales bacterium]
MQSGSTIIIQFLESVGVRVVSGMPGGANLPLYDALFESKLLHVLARHEQGGGFIAQGMTRASGFPGVCFATSGPGVTNLVTALADAKMDSIPLLAITGQVPRALIGTDAFQEVDTCAMVQPLVKRAYFVSKVDDLFWILPEAWSLCQEGRPGPVLIDVPKDIQIELTSGDFVWPVREKLNQTIEQGQIDSFIGELTLSERPILYIGGGAINSDASALIRQLADTNGIPVVSTLMGLGAFPSDHPWFLGMLGMHGEASTNHILEESDLLIALGVRFDDRATGKLDEFCPSARVVHVDVDARELGKLRVAELAIRSDLKEFLSQSLHLVPKNDRADWKRHIASLRNAHPSENTSDDVVSNFPGAFLRGLSEILDPEDIITTDVGQHQMWTAQSYPFKKPRTLLTSGGLGTMGFGLPAAIGAALARPEATVVCISGDGSILLNIQELALLHEFQLNVKVIVMDNGHLGLVRQQQELFYEERISAARFQSSPDFCALANSFGIQAMRFGGEMSELKGVLETNGPVMIHVPMESSLNVYPMVAPGKANRDMIRGEVRF